MEFWYRRTGELVVEIGRLKGRLHFLPPERFGVEVICSSWDAFHVSFLSLFGNLKNLQCPVLREDINARDRNGVFTP